MKNIRKKVFITLWSILLGGIAIIVVFFLLIFNGAIGYMPDIDQLGNPVNKFASQVYTADGKLLGTWSYSSANRIFVSYDQLPPMLVKALVATEDERFYDHCGIDFRSVGRAVVKRGLMGNKNAGGGSTITQQLAKQLYSEKAEDTRTRLLQKPIEWVIALKLERYYTKEEIITLYLNHFDFLHNAVGIKTAAKTYFNKEPKDLSINECALLVGMCKNPSYYNPVRQPERCELRRNIVLGQMLRSGYISEMQYDSCKAEPLKLNYQRQDHKDGQGTYLREYLRQVLMAKKPNRADYASWQDQKFYEDSLSWENDSLYGWCNKHRKRDGSYYNLYTDGLRIYTTIDSRMQQYAEEAVNEHVALYLQPAFDKEHKSNSKSPYHPSTPADKRQRLINKAMRQSERWMTMKKAGCGETEIEKAFNTPVEMTLYAPTGEIETTMTPLDSLLYYKRFLRASFMCMDNRTGEVKAYVGGLDYAHFQYDMATQGKRQVGSTIKPYLYALAMENNYTPCSVVPDVKKNYGGWTPRGGGSGGMVTLRQALASSNNTVSAYLIDQLRPTQFVEMLRQFGIKQRHIDATYPLCLGAVEISLAEMIGGYSAFPNKGVRKVPIYVTRIEDNEGNVLANLANGLPPQSKEVISAPSSYRMLTLMKGVVNSGTGARMRSRYGINAPMGGKTGTTNDNSDGWFVGYTPRYTFGAWVGGEERDIHMSSMAYAQGAAAALPICALFLKKVYADRSLGVSATEEFSIPADHSDCDNGLGPENWGWSNDPTGVDELMEY
ncbi:MAG: transglycosylase domain-containing protein [Bacteroidales bacterium]|nr:transglycosylase domain-containing protein [Candidatus Physcousia equi]